MGLATKAARRRRKETRAALNGARWHAQQGEALATVVQSWATLWHPLADFCFFDAVRRLSGRARERHVSRSRHSIMRSEAVYRAVHLFCGGRGCVVEPAPYRRSWNRFFLCAPVSLVGLLLSGKAM